jgi:hypothetical protein
VWLGVWLAATFAGCARGIDAFNGDMGLDGGSGASGGVGPITSGTGGATTAATGGAGGSGAAGVGASSTAGGAGPAGSGGSGGAPSTTTAGGAGAGGSMGPTGGSAGIGGTGGRGGAGGASGASGAGGAGGSGGASGAAGRGGGGSGGAAGAGGAGPCGVNAIRFDGAGTYATTPRLVQDDFTVEAWIQTSTASPTGTNFWNGVGLVYADVQFNANDFGATIVNNHFAFGVGNPDTTVEGTSNVTTGQWVHVAATRTKSTGSISVIVNGVLEKTVVATNVASLNAPPAIAFGANNVDAIYYTGLMDEIRIWNVARSAATISANMHRRLAGNESGLVGYWRLDESTGSSALDASPSNSAAIFVGNPSHVPSTAPLTTCP